MHLASSVDHWLIGDNKNMSTANNTASDMTMMSCASCGVSGVDNVKLMKCNGCYLVRYCGIECQRDHWRQHKRACKKRAAELRDELLFKQPESTHLGECPLCMIPLTLDEKNNPLCSSCFIMMCNGCNHANMIRELDMRRKPSCPFCRKPAISTDAERANRRLTRIEAGNPVALSIEGRMQHEKGEYIKAFKHFTKAAELGDAEGHYRLSMMYLKGRGVDQDRGKGIYHLEEAAIGGHPTARFRLGIEEGGNRNWERAVKHFVIAAKQGQDDSMEALMSAFEDGLVSKAELASALRAHQAAVDATKSPQREEVEDSR